MQQFVAGSREFEIFQEIDTRHDPAGKLGASLTELRALFPQCGLGMGCSKDLATQALAATRETYTVCTHCAAPRKIHIRILKQPRQTPLSKPAYARNSTIDSRPILKSCAPKSPCSSRFFQAAQSRHSTTKRSQGLATVSELDRGAIKQQNVGDRSDLSDMRPCWYKCNRRTAGLSVPRVEDARWSCLRSGGSAFCARFCGVVVI